MGRLELDAEAASDLLEAEVENSEGKSVDETSTEATSAEAGEKSIISDVDPGEAGAENTKEEAADQKKADASADEAAADDAEDKDGEEKKEEDEDKTPDPDSFEANYESWTEEFMANGSLSEETRVSVISKVFHDDVPDEVKAQYVEAYEAGLTAIASAATRGAQELVGGQEKYQQMIGWAQENLSEAEIAAYDNDACGNDLVLRDTAIKGLHARFQQATGSEPDFEPNLAHDGGRSQGEPIIGSRQELAKIQATPEYAKDPAVRAKVARQLEQSMATGKYLG